MDRDQLAVSWRPESAGDDAFVRRIILETVAEQLGAQAWPEPMRTQLLDLQLRARRYPPDAPRSRTDSRIVLVNGQPAGWMVVSEEDEDIRLVEIMILAEHRGKDIGSTCIRDIFATADRSGKPVRLHVQVLNHRAIALYERLGFRRIGGNDVHHFMERASPVSRTTERQD